MSRCDFCCEHNLSRVDISEYGLQVALQIIKRDAEIETSQESKNKNHVRLSTAVRQLLKDTIRCIKGRECKTPHRHCFDPPGLFARAAVEFIYGNDPNFGMDNEQWSLLAGLVDEVFYE